MAHESGTAPFEPEALALAVDELGEALRALQAHDQRPRTGPVGRAAIREKARTGRLKPMRGLGATGPVESDETPSAVVMPTTGTGTLPFADLEDAAAAALDAALSSTASSPAALSHQEPA